MSHGNENRKGRQIVVWMDDELVDGIEAVRGHEDRSAWIRRKLGEALQRGERPLLGVAPVRRALRDTREEPPRPEVRTFGAHVRW